MKTFVVAIGVMCILCAAVYGQHELSPYGKFEESAKLLARQRYMSGNPLPSFAYLVAPGEGLILRWQPANSTAWISHGKYTELNPAGYVNAVGVSISKSYVFVCRWERYTPTERFRQVFGGWIDLNDWPAIEREWIERLRLLRATGGDMRVAGLPHSGMYPGESIKVCEPIGAWVVFKN